MGVDLLFLKSEYAGQTLSMAWLLMNQQPQHWMLGYTAPCFAWGMVLKTCAIWLVRNDTKYKYIVIFARMNWARQGIRINLVNAAKTMSERKCHIWNREIVKPSKMETWRTQTPATSPWPMSSSRPWKTWKVSGSNRSSCWMGMLMVLIRRRIPMPIFISGCHVRGSIYRAWLAR